MLVLFLVSIGLVLVFSILLFSLASLAKAALAGAPYVPASKGYIEAARLLIEPVEGKYIADLGSGDGRVVRALARHGARADGYEIQWGLVVWAKLLKLVNRQMATNYYRQNLFSVNLKNYDAVVLYALPSMMEQLRHKFESELKPGTKVVSFRFPIVGWKETKSTGRVYLYEIGKTK